MKTYLTLIALVLLIISHGVLSPLSGQWIKNTIDENFFVGEKFAYIIDMDNDGDLDVIATSYDGDMLVWYENANLTWTKHIIDDNLDSPLFPYVADIDGDDTLDVIVTAYLEDDVVWYENNHPAWTKHIIDGNLDGAEYAIAADIDKDDDQDVVVAGLLADVVVWYENDNLSWTRHIIDHNLDSPASIAVGDLDNDDTLDVAANASTTNDLVWYKNKNAGQSWTKYTIDGNLDGSWHSYLADINDDDTLDVVATGKIANNVVWYENHHPTWEKYIIDDNLIDVHAVTVADFDGDKDLDVAATSNGEDIVVWYENNNLFWTRHNVDDYVDGARWILAADIDGDSKEDLFVANDNSNQVIWYHYKPAVAHAKSVQCYPKFISSQGDTLVINTTLYNRDNHPATVQAFISSEQHAFKDSIQLYDDGQHQDSLASDNIWGNSKWLSGLPEDIFTIGISSYDLTEDYQYNLSPVPCFTTIGPIVFDGWTPHFIDDSIPNPGDILSFKIHLKHEGSTTDVEFVEARLSSTDDRITIEYDYSNFGDIVAGSTVESRRGFSLSISDDFDQDTVILLPIKISSEGIHFWTDNIGLDIVTALETQHEFVPKSFALDQNYPNPFNPVTMINYQLPARSAGGPMINDVELSVYNLIGQKIATLVKEQQQAGYHQVEWDAAGFASGIYYYRIEAGKFQDVKKMILIK